MDEAAIKLVDASGKTVFTTVKNVQGSSNMTFNIDLPAGLYFLQVETQSAQYLEKLVIRP